jgi:hypothetical protein
MAHATHEKHEHVHGGTCGHTAVKHDDHTDYVHDGHLHHEHEGHIDEHELSMTAKNPVECTTGHACSAHNESHVHGAQCGHETVPHAGHVDYLVQGHLHNQHGSHCDHHGAVQL